MFEIRTTEDIALLRESWDLECKKAGGRDGQGAVPESLWETYSAMANTDGGVVLLGVMEKNGRFSVFGLSDPDRLRRDIFSTANNPDKVSANLLGNASIQDIEIEGKTILRIDVPRASRAQRPVFLNGNPLGGNAYRRLHESDQRLSDEAVKRFLAEQVEDSRDSGVLPPGFTQRDLAQESVRGYRQAHQNLNPGHPWGNLDDLAFLEKIGAWRQDRVVGTVGMTGAGLLMFGTHPVIQQAFPHYMLDYQERPEAKTELRWIDRVTLDGTWSGNLYDFYRKVYRKLVADLKTPFHLEGGQRKEETPVHVALREALVNALVHADYSDRASVLVVKRPDMFGFRNPGTMRIPVEIALKGGEADCRNRLLHQMFRYIGLGEQSGSGIPKILEGWKLSHWRPPLLHEKMEPYDQTLMELRMLDLFPHDVVNLLRKALGSRYEQLGYAGQVAMALALTEETLTHGRLAQLTDDHPTDLSRVLHRLVQEEGLLTRAGSGRGAVYHLSGLELPQPGDVFGEGVNSPLLAASSPPLTASSPPLTASSPPLTASSPLPIAARDRQGRLRSEHLRFPVVDQLTLLAPDARLGLEKVAHEPRRKKKVSREVMQAVILALCDGQYVTLGALADLVKRKPKPLRARYLSPMVKQRSLALAFPTAPSDPRQAYLSSRPDGDSGGGEAP